MEVKSWKQRLEEGEKAKDIVFSEPKMDLGSWEKRIEEEGLSEYGKEYILRCVERFDRTTLKDYVD
jgi:hypothetical protein